MDILTKLSDLCIKIIFPVKPFCIICNKKILADRNRVCSVCEENIVKITPPICRKCGRQLKNDTKDICNDCSNTKHYFIEARAFGHYEGILRKLIYQFKYRGQKDLALFLGVKMFSVLETLSWPAIDFIVPVPLHRSRLKERGYNQALLLAKVLNKNTGIPISEELIRAKATEHQTILTRSYRQRNLANAFAIRRNKFCNKTILLIDDVYTTGTTVNECSKTLKKAGAKEIYVLTCARG